MLAKSRSLFYLELEGFSMNKTGLKTFVYSFVLTLSAIVVADKVFFVAPKDDVASVVVPRKNIALFFGGDNHQSFSSKIVPVRKIALQKTQTNSQEVAIAQNVSDLMPDLVVKDIPSIADRQSIPLQKMVATIDELEEGENTDSVPLVYNVSNQKTEKIVSAQSDVVKRVEDGGVVPNADVASVDLLKQPVVVKGTRQIIKIDNLKKKQEQKKQEQKDIQLAHVPLDVVEDGVKVVGLDDVSLDSQVASVNANEPIVHEEVKVENAISEEARKWQTMAEKNQNENPWVVARGSKFVKNKKVLDEDFASEVALRGAKDKGLLPKSVAEGKSKAKLAVQDNFLIPIPQDLLDDDNLVPNLGDEDKKKVKTKSVKKEGNSSFLDSITSVFSKENREKAIKNLKARGGKLLEDGRTQILPTEIRLSFQPNRAEISGQTLRWIQAFAKKAAEEDDVGLEIRIDGSGAFALQQKRLNLLYNILTANGVGYQKINTVFADREANSFVVRTVKITKGAKDKEVDGWKKYYQHW